MIGEAKMTELSQVEDTAYFRADLCVCSSESYTLEEKKEICNDMISSSKAVLDAVREGFERLSLDARPSSLTCSAPPASRVPSGGGMCPRAIVRRGRHCHSLLARNSFI